jgi:transcriptional regulator with XRE-family HTH domain
MARLNGARAFSAWLRKHGISQAAAAKALGVSQPTVHYWLQAVRPALPSEAIRRDIERWTDGEVLAESWPLGDRRQKAPRVKPLKGADDAA